MQRRRLVVALLAGLLPLSAGAEIFRCLGVSGKPFYTLEPSEICRAAARVPQQAPRAPARAIKASMTTPADFPRVEASAQRARDGLRREILETELATEMQLHAKARGEDVAHHARNIEALRKELSFLR